MRRRTLSLRLEQDRIKIVEARIVRHAIGLLRVWWREGRLHSLLLPGGWLFPGRNPVEPLSARQFCRAVHAAAPGGGDQEALKPCTVMSSIMRARSGPMG
jgi:hypothetical protein